MKKTLLTMVFGLCALCGFAQTTKTYTDNLVVTVNGASTPPMPAQITMEELADGTCNLSLKNFALVMGGETMAVGNINLDGITLVDEGDYRSFATKQVIRIQPGDDENIPDDAWVGPMLQDVPIDMQGRITGDKLYCTIDIDMQATLGQTIGVVFGSLETAIHSTTLAQSAVRVNVYNVNGQCIHRGVAAKDAFSGLAKGIYIVNGKKIIK